MVAPPLSALQIRIFLLCALVVLLDGYDLSAMGLAVPALGRDWHWPTACSPRRLTASVIGLGLGSAFIAPLGDRLGPQAAAAGRSGADPGDFPGRRDGHHTLAAGGVAVAGGSGAGRGSEQCLGTHRRVRAARAPCHHHDADGRVCGAGGSAWRV